MTHSVMYFGIGFVIAALLGLLAVLHVHRRATLQIPADVRQFDDQLAVALGERSKLLGQTAAMRRDAELTWAADRIEIALFRERINDLTFEIVRITQAIDGLGSSIEPTSAYLTPAAEDGRRMRALGVDGASNEASAVTTNAGVLADRIRALRTVASRAPEERSL